MNIIKTIAKQEIDKVFKNKKMLSSIFVLPLIILAALFAMTSMSAEETQSACQIYFLNMPIEEQESILNDITLTISSNPAISYEQFVSENDISETDIIVEPTTEGFQIYYNSFHSITESLLPVIKSNILKPYAESMFLAQHGVVKENFEVIVEDTSSELERTNRTASLLLPYLMIIILFMNLVSVVGDSIAGEKERGTLIKQFLAPIDNSQIILGKLLGTTFIGMISSAVFFVVLIGGSYVASRFGKIDILGIEDGAITAGQIGIMFFGFIFIAMVFVAAIALMSSFAKTTKEAANMSLIVYYMVIIAALATGFTVGEMPKLAYLIPVYNFSVFMHKLFVGNADIANGVITVISLVVTFGLLSTATIINFRREKIIC